MHPAAADVDGLRIAEVVEDVVVVAPGVLECICQDGEAVEGALVVDAMGEHDNRGSAPHWIEW